MKTIADFLGRSTSYVFRVLKFNQALKRLYNSWVDLRKLPARYRNLSAVSRRKMMEKLQNAWTAWIFGEGEKPP